MNLGKDRLGQAALSSVLRLRRHRPPRWLPVLAYHRVVPRPDDSFPFDRGVVDCDPAEFERHMALIARECSPIDLEMLLGFTRGEAQLPPNPVLVTFDDGYRDNLDCALPVLVRHHIPAVFFIASAYVTERRVFWWDRIAYLLHNAQAASAHLHYPTELVLTPRSGRVALNTALRLIKTRPGLDLDRFLDDLGRALGVPWDQELEHQLADQLIQTWDHVRALSAAGMEIGSHTRSHRVILTLEPDEIAGELAGSRADIEREVGAPVRALSYPAGRPLRPVPALAQAVEAAGYQLGFSTEARANFLAQPLDRFDLARLTIDIGVSAERLHTLLAAPELCVPW